MREKKALSFSCEKSSRIELVCDRWQWLRMVELCANAQRQRGGASASDKSLLTTRTQNISETLSSKTASLHPSPEIPFSGSLFLLLNIPLAQFVYLVLGYLRLDLGTLSFVAFN